MSLPPTPEPLEQLVPRHDAALLERERVQEPELRRRQPGALAVNVRLHLAGSTRSSSISIGSPRWAAGRACPRRAGRPPGHELLHGERLDEVVVRSDLERVDGRALFPGR